MHYHVAAESACPKILSQQSERDKQKYQMMQPGKGCDQVHPHDDQRDFPAQSHVKRPARPAGKGRQPDDAQGKPPPQPATKRHGVQQWRPVGVLAEQTGQADAQGLVWGVSQAQPGQAAEPQEAL